MELKCRDLGESETATAVLHGEYATPLREPPGLVLDIGANIGAFSRWAKIQWPDARVIAYEPQHAAAEMFRRNLGGDAELVQSAVSDHAGRSRLHKGVNNSCQGGLRKQRWNNGRTERVVVVDSASLPAADFIKIDTEGSELDILQHLDLSRAQGIALEWHSEKDRVAIHEFLNGRGFLMHERFPTLNGCGVSKFTRGTIPGRVYLGLPVYGQMPFEFVYCIERLQLLQNPGIVYGWKPGDSLVSRARNRITADFLETNCSDLLFIDTDLVFSNDHIARMMAHKEPIVGGCYPKKQTGDVQWVLNGLDAGSTVRDDGLQQVKYVGTGFMRIKREVFEKLMDTAPAYRCDSTGRLEHDFWKVGVYTYPDGNTRYLSEDWYFCQEAIDHGYEIWADTRTVLKHLGQVAFPVGGCVTVKG